MPSTNGHGPKRAILYARVSTDDQVRGYSLNQQIEALREWAASEGYEVLEDVRDEGWSAAYLERPGLDRVRDIVEGGSVSVVVAQDADRITRDPAHRAFLDNEFERFGTRLIALDDWGDDTHEGELLKYMKGWVSKGERLKITERTRRGKLQKARQGKVVAGPRPNFGFKYNATRDNYVVDQEQMDIIRRIFREVGAEGRSMYSVKRALDREGVTPPSGGRYWSLKYIRDRINDDVYSPHTYEEVSALVSPVVAIGLDPSKRYGVWWFNRRRYEARQVAENGPDGERRYGRRITVREKPHSEWIAVPVPNSGIPRQWVDAARAAIKHNARPSANAHRVWELSGGVLICGECECRMATHTTTDKKRGYAHHYYRCAKRNRHGALKACTHGKFHKAETTEGAVWELVSSLLKDPQRLRAGLEQLIEQECSGLRGDPDREAKHWLEKLSELEQERKGYLRLAAKGHMSDDDLGEALSELEDARLTAQSELEVLQGRKAAIEALQQDRDTLLESYAAMIPDALDSLAPEERYQIYGMLRLKVEVSGDGTMQVQGVLSDRLHMPDGEGESLCENGLASPSTI